MDMRLGGVVMLKRILVGVSGTPALEAKINYTLELARIHGAEVQLIDVVDVDRLGEIGPIPIGAGHFAERMIAKRIETSHEISDSAVRTFTNRCLAANIKAETLSHEGDPLAVVAGLWRYADIVVLGARGWFDHKVLDDPEEALGQVIATGVRPILAVPDEARQIKKVAIFYNGALEAAKAMKHYILFNPYPDVKEAELVCLGDSKTGERPDDLLDDARSFLALHGISAQSHVIPSEDVVESALEFVEENNIDLIVMGGSYHRVLLSKRFGRATLGILRRANVPVFLSH